tara:strand:- start:744 stop:1211 length:468 start_codon:yes stop_codon:yes gene_type:complete
MKLSAIKTALTQVASLKFQLPNGKMVPTHFHLTELGLLTRNFIDCGGTVREEKKINFQLWEEKDFDHRLMPKGVLGIIAIAEKIFNLENLEIEVEYQSETIGKYNLEFENGIFQLKSTLTACLALDNCGIPTKAESKVPKLANATNSCAPGSGCC